MSLIYLLKPKYPSKIWDYGVITFLAFITYFIPALIIKGAGSGFSPIWPSAGVAAFLAIKYKKKAFLGIFFGSVAGNLIYLKWPLISLFLICIGNAAAPVIAAYLLEKSSSAFDGFDNVGNFIRFLIFMCLLNPLLSAAIGAFSFYINPGVTSFPLGIFFNWTLSDSMAAVSICPALYLYSKEKFLVKEFFRKEAGNIKILLPILLAYFFMILLFYKFFPLIGHIDRETIMLCLMLPIFVLSLKLPQKEVLSLNFLILYSILYVFEVRTMHFNIFYSAILFSNLQVSGIVVSFIAISITLLVKERNLAISNLENVNSTLDSQVKKRTAMLAQSEEIFHSIAHKAPVGILIYQEVMKYANEFTLDIFGYTEKEFYSIKPWDIISDMDEKKLAKEKITEKLNGKSFDGSYSFNISTKNGEKHIFNFYTTTITYEGKPAGLAVFTDETERKILETLRNDFMSMVSHEIRTPLASLVGFTRLIEMKVSEVLNQKTNISACKENILNYTGIMLAEGVRLSELVSDILDLDKIESGKMQWNDTLFDLKEAAGSSIDSVSSLIDNSEVILLLNTEGNMPEILADKNKIIQVFVNLLSNALKFTEKGEIILTISTEGNFIKISISDTGSGIYPEDLDSIFDKFTQGSYDAYLGRPKGSGLGLSISKHIVEHYGGRIWAESNPGRGSIFYFTIPYPKY